MQRHMRKHTCNTKHEQSGNLHSQKRISTHFLTPFYCFRLLLHAKTNLVKDSAKYPACRNNPEILRLDCCNRHTCHEHRSVQPLPFQGSHRNRQSLTHQHIILIQLTAPGHPCINFYLNRTRPLYNFLFISVTASNVDHNQHVKSDKILLSLNKYIIHKTTYPCS